MGAEAGIGWERSWGRRAEVLVPCRELGGRMRSKVEGSIPSPAAGQGKAGTGATGKALPNWKNSKQRSCWEALEALLVRSRW